MSKFDTEAGFAHRARICVIGVGGGGGNAVDRMIDGSLPDIDFIAVNTDAQALNRSRAKTRIQLGEKLTSGLGAGGKPEVGAKSAEESREAITAAISKANMLFVTAGMGGGTGTGAAPIIAKISKSMDILTVGVVTKPFAFEGPVRMKNAMAGIDELLQNVDTLLVIPNEKLLQVMPPDAPFLAAFAKADEVLTHSVYGLARMISDEGMVNLDFADIEAIMRDQGVAHIGIGTARGKNRAVQAAEAAMNSPLLDTSIKGANALLVYVTAPPDLGMTEANESVSFILQNTGIGETNLIFGVSIDENLKDEFRVTIVATGFETNESGEIIPALRRETRVDEPAGDNSDIPQIKPSSDDKDGQILLPIFPQKRPTGRF